MTRHFSLARRRRRHGHRAAQCLAALLRGPSARGALGATVALLVVAVAGCGLLAVRLGAMPSLWWSAFLGRSGGSSLLRAPGAHFGGSSSDLLSMLVPTHTCVRERVRATAPELTPRVRRREADACTRVLANGRAMSTLHLSQGAAARAVPSLRRAHAPCPAARRAAPWRRARRRHMHARARRGARAA